MHKYIDSQVKPHKALWTICSFECIMQSRQGGLYLVPPTRTNFFFNKSENIQCSTNENLQYSSILKSDMGWPPSENASCHSYPNLLAFLYDALTQNMYAGTKTSSAYQCLIHDIEAKISGGHPGSQHFQVQRPALAASIFLSGFL